MRSRLALALAALLAFTAIAGCTARAESGSASIYVKDAPLLGFDEIHVVFTQVQVEVESEDEDDDGNETGEQDDEAEGTSNANGQDGADHEGQDEDEGQDEEDERVTLFSDPSGVDVDLLAANGTKAAFLGEADLPAGDYDEILVTVKEAYGIQNGTRVDFVLEETVVELEHVFLVGSGRETRLVIDFDLTESLERKDGAWHMDLEVREIEDDDVDDDESGEEHDEDEGEIRDFGDDEDEED